MSRTRAGFSLLELMVVLALLAILLAFSVPAWQQHQLKAGRQAAWLQLQRIGLQQEMWQLQQGAYFSDMANVSPAPKTTAYRYSIELIAEGYLLTAHVQTTGPQAQDASCQRLTLSHDGSLKSYGTTGASHGCL